MIWNINFSNFKALDGRSFALRHINIFSGYNGRGKSSVMQGILMLTQSLRDTGSLAKLHLNGSQVMLGDYKELLADLDNPDVAFEYLLDDQLVQKVELKYGPTDDYMVGLIKALRVNDVDFFDTAGKAGDEIKDKRAVKELLRPLPQSLYNQFANVHYISADRIGPVRFVERKEIPDFHSVGTRGDFTVNTISTYSEMIPAVMNVRVDDKTEHSLKQCVTEWVDYIMDDGRVAIIGEEHETNSSVLSLGFAFKDNQRVYNSYNVGFGYSYILSVVVATLIAKKGSTLMVENPEAHLHPEAQIRLTLLLSKLAERGVQVFIETHSEHIVNGFRINVLEDKCSLANDQLAIFFFDRDFSIKQLEVSPNGRIQNWPKHFFDQFEEEMVKILSLGANKK